MENRAHAQWKRVGYTHFYIMFAHFKTKEECFESNNGLPMPFPKLIKTLLTKLGKSLITGLTPGSPYQKFIVKSTCNETCWVIL